MSLESTQTGDGPLAARVVSLARRFATPARRVQPGLNHAEDWLMPHAAAVSGADLEVIDAAGHLDAGLQEVFSTDSWQWDCAQLESLFLRLDFMTARPHLATRLEGQRETVAAIVLMRELAHHAKLERVTLRGKVL